MPLTAQQLTQAHRRQQLALRKVTLDEMGRLWPALSWDDLDGTYPVLAGAAAEMVAKYRRTSAGLSAAYLRAFRVASGLDGDVRVVLPPVLNVEQFDATLHSLAVAGVKTATSRGVPQEDAMTNALTLASGAMARLVLDASRDSILGTIQADDRATGWRRVLGRGGCTFCKMLADRGAVYKEETVDFASHSKCGCTASPEYGDGVKSAKDYVPSDRFRSDEARAKHNAQVRKWLRENPTA